MIECQIEVFLNIFTVDDEKLKILLLKKEGSIAWRLPSRLLKIDESLESSATKICNKFKMLSTQTALVYKILCAVKSSEYFHHN